MKSRVMACVLFFALMLWAVHGIAAEAELTIDAAADNEIGVITVTGNAPAAWGRRKIVIMVCKPAQNKDIDFDSMDEAAFLQNVYTVREVMCEKDGSFSEQIALAEGAVSGYYRIRAGASGVANNAENDKEVLFVDATTAEKVLAQVNAAQSAETLKTVLEGTAMPENLPNREILSLNLEDEIYSAHSLAFCEYLYAKRGKGYQKISDLQNMFPVCRALTDITFCGESEIKAKIEIYASLLDIDTECSEYRQNSDAIAKLVQGNAKDLIRYGTETAKFFRAMTAVAAINTADRTKVMQIAEKYAESLGITLGAEYKALDSYEVGKALVGKNFSTVQAVRDALSARIEELTAEKKKNDSKGSSGGGSSGGGKGSGLGIDTPTPIAPIGQADSNPQQPAFSDVPQEHWAYESIAALTEKGVLGGMGDGQFLPDETVTREQLAKMLSVAFAITESGEVPFNDVQQSAWYAPYVEKVYAGGFVKGISGTEFGVGRPVNRQDFIVILYRILQNKNVVMKSAEPAFQDASEIADYAKDAVGAMAAIGAVKGTNEGNMEPKRTASRAEAAKLIYEAMQLAEKGMGVE